jgi:hypothetical protein
MLGQCAKIGNDYFLLCPSEFIIILSFYTIQVVSEVHGTWHHFRGVFCAQKQ